MKNLYKIFSLFLLFSSVIACTFNGQDGEPGPVGPQGPAGQDGVDGADGQDGLISYVLEYNGVDFFSPNYEAFLEFPPDSENFQIYSSDVVLVYILWEYDDNDNPIWRALPQTYYHPEGEFTYNFDYTLFDARIFLEGNFNLDFLGGALTDNNTIRVVIVPAAIVNGRTATPVDYGDMNAVLKYYEFDEEQIIKINN